MRKCANPRCQREIKRCFGFVIARDVIMATIGNMGWKNVRELCGRCVFRLEQSPQLFENILGSNG